MRSIFLALFVSMATNALATDQISQVNGQTNGLGAGGTVFSTWGFMYRHHFDNGFGITTSLGGWLDSNRGHLGNELGGLYTLAHHHFGWEALPEASIRVYLVGYFANILRRNYHYNDYYNSKDTKKIAWETGLGAGPGVEFFFNRYFSLSAELPWMTFMRISEDGLAFLNSYPHFGGGVVYYF